MKKIIFIDTQNEKSNSFHLDRQDFYSKLNKEYKIPVVENIATTNKADIVFVHQSFYSDSNLMISSSERNPIVKDAIFVFYGNNSQEKIEITTDEVSYFNFYVLEQNFKAFINELTSNDLQDNSWNALLGFDHVLEELLKAFVETSPYETNNKQGKILKEAKAELLTYVEDYLKKQSKP